MKNTVNKLLNLKRLRDNCVITSDEFEKVRAKILEDAMNGRDNTDLDLCDVCYWRKRANDFSTILNKIAADTKSYIITKNNSNTEAKAVELLKRINIWLDSGKGVASGSWAHHEIRDLVEK